MKMSQLSRRAPRPPHGGLATKRRARAPRLSAWSYPQVREAGKITGTNRRGLARSIGDVASIEPRLLNNAPPGLRGLFF
jgi:hypothetical protein